MYDKAVDGNLAALAQYERQIEASEKAMDNMLNSGRNPDVDAPQVGIDPKAARGQ